MTEPFRSGFVCLVGRPNVGKSTLLNRLVQRPISITAAKPQTTRNRILGVRHEPNCQIVFVDTPGIHQAEAQLNRRMIGYALSALKEAELVLVVTEPGLDTDEDTLVFEHLRQARRSAVLVLNKIDTVPQEAVLDSLKRHATEGLFEEVVPVSALTGDNVERLLPVIQARLPPGPPYFDVDQITDQTESALIGEWVRQEVIRRTHQELPYRTAVRVESMHEQQERLVIDASIFVERDSQKGIVIGKGGAMLKAIGTAARKQIEAVLGVRIYLHLNVRVLERWSENPRHLAALGYPEA